MYNSKNFLKKLLTISLAAAMAAGCMTTVSLVSYAAEEESYFVDDLPADENETEFAVLEGDFLADDNYTGEGSNQNNYLNDTFDIIYDLDYDEQNGINIDSFDDEHTKVSGDFEIGWNEDGTATLLNYTGNSETVEIPETIEGFTIVRIGHMAFRGNETIKKVTFPDTLDSIGAYAFCRCKSLSDVVLPENLTTIYSDAFELCTALRSIDIPASVKTLYPLAFCRCVSLETVTLHEGLETIANAVFCEDESLKGIVIPSTVKSIDVAVFNRSKSLEEICLAQGNENYVVIDGVLFNKDCTRLISYPAGKKDEVYYVPDTVRTIMLSSFIGASDLKEVMFPQGLEYIGWYSMSECSGLKKILIPENVQKMGLCAVGYIMKSNIALEDETATDSDLTTDKNFVIYGTAGSQAESYAKGYGFTFRDASEYVRYLQNKTTVSKQKFTVGETVTVTGDAEGGSGRYTYEFYYKRANAASWTRLGKDGKANFKPGSAGEFTIRTYVKDELGNTTKKDFSLTAMAPLENKTTVSKESFNVGETVTVAGNAAGGDGQYTYEFYYKRANSTSWTRFGKDGKASFKPGSAGEFTVRTYVKDGTGKTVKKDFTLTAAASLENKTTVSKTSFNVGETVLVSGAASGGDGQYTYEFYYKRANASTWTRFGSGSKASFKPGSAGSFTIRTYVKDGTGKTVKKDFSLTAV